MAKTPSIEECFEQIEGIIEDLEGGELPLDKALARYEEALKKVRLARKHLDSFQGKLEELRADNLLADEAEDGYEV